MAGKNKMKKQINVTGKINSFGTHSIESAEVFFNSGKAKYYLILKGMWFLILSLEIISINILYPSFGLIVGTVIYLIYDNYQFERYLDELYGPVE